MQLTRIFILPTMLLLNFSLVTGCEKAASKVQEPAFTSAEIKAGIALLPTYCNNCHAVTEDAPDMLAPSLWSISLFYKARYSEPELFVQSMQQFMEEPNRENALMKHSVNKYGLMPEVSLSSEDLRNAAIAVYSVDHERPKWARDYLKEHQAKLSALKTDSD